MRYRDRADAGRRLARLLKRFARDTPVVLGLPCGGVPVAAEIASALRAPLDVLVVRKLGVPGRPEYAMGALGEGQASFVDPDVVRGARVREADLAAEQARRQHELDHLRERLRAHRTPVPLAGRTAIVVDDGMATGATARVACRMARSRGAARVVLAVPVASPAAVAALAGEADEVVCLHRPRSLRSVGQYYADFGQVAEDDAALLLQGHATA